jgi:uncharacterized protein (DUF433 family)
MTSSLSSTSISRYVTRNPEVLQGEPIIADTQVTVRDIVVFWKSGIKPEEIPQKLLLKFLMRLAFIWIIS